MNVRGKQVNFSFPKNLRRFVVVVLIVAIIAPSGSLLAPQKSDAFLVPIGDWLNTAFQVITSIAGYFGQTKEGIWDAIAWSIAKMALRQLTASLVDWINSGFDGGPAFITDPGAFFLDIGDQVIGDFITGTELGFLCDPLNIGIDIRAAISLNHFGSFRDRISCRLSEVVGNVQNANAFLSGDFMVGGRAGWSSWLALTQIPQHNIYGGYMKASLQANARAYGNTRLNEKISDWSKGWKSKLSCTGQSRTGRAAERYYGESQGGDCFISLPGNFVSDQITEAFGSSRRSLEAADEIGEMVDSVLGALMNQALIRGFSALSQSSQGQNRYTTTLRSGDPTAPFYRADPNQQAQWGSVNDELRGQNQNLFDAEYNTRNAYAQSTLPGSDFGGVPQNPKVGFQNAFADQNCTYTPSMGISGSPVNAIDGQTFSYSDNRCVVAGGTVSPFGWWEVTLEAPEFLDMVQFETYDGTEVLRRWQETITDTNGTRTVNKGPFLILSNEGSDGPGGYVNECEITLFDGADNEQINLTRAVATTRRYDPRSGAGVCANLTRFQTQKVRFEAALENPTSGNENRRSGIVLREVQLFRHLRPVLDTRNVPTLIASTTAQNLDPRPANWVTGIYYPYYNDPQPIVDQSRIDVLVKDQQGQIVYPSAAGGGILRYQLSPGSYRFEYTATIGGFRSATSTRSVAVQ